MHCEVFSQFEKSELDSTVDGHSGRAGAPEAAIGDGVDGRRIPVQAKMLSSVENLGDHELTRWVERLSRRKQITDADLLACLSEIERRKLYRDEACPSFFEYLTRRLGYSEDAAYRRMWCSRMLRDYPLTYSLLRSGKIHQAALLLLKPHLTPENHRERLMAAVGKSKRDVERLVASFAPKPDVPSTIRRQAERAVQRAGAVGAPPTPHDVPRPSVPASGTPNSAVLPERGHQPSELAAAEGASLAKDSSGRAEEVMAPARSSRVSPLSEATYRVSFTASQALKEKLERAGALVSHVLSPRDLPGLIERALDLLIEKEEGRRFGVPRSGSGRKSGSGASGGLAGIAGRRRPQRDASDKEAHPTDATSACGATPGVDATEARGATGATAGRIERRTSSYIPRAVRRAVWERDGGRCTYVSSRGDRCGCRHHLQFDHRIARSLGGRSTVANLRLRCAAHNAWAAEQVFGQPRVAAAIAGARARASP